MKYEKAIAEVIAFDNSDVITTSGNCPGNSNNKNSGGGMGCKNAPSNTGGGNQGNCNGGLPDIYDGGADYQMMNDAGWLA